MLNFVSTTYVNALKFFIPRIQFNPVLVNLQTSDLDLNWNPYY